MGGGYSRQACFSGLLTCAAVSPLCVRSRLLSWVLFPPSFWSWCFFYSFRGISAGHSPFELRFGSYSRSCIICFFLFYIGFTAGLSCLWIFSISSFTCRLPQRLGWIKYACSLFCFIVGSFSSGSRLSSVGSLLVVFTHIVFFSFSFQ